jgi:hypothetical protein
MGFCDKPYFVSGTVQKKGLKTIAANYLSAGTSNMAIRWHLLSHIGLHRSLNTQEHFQ